MDKRSRDVESKQGIRGASQLVQSAVVIGFSQNITVKYEEWRGRK